MYRFNKIILVYTLMKVINVLAGNCRNGTTCIELAKCKGLENGRQREEQLRCGLTDNPNEDMMVCCPSQFLNSLSTEATQADDETNPSTASLLPNVSLCGIQNTDRMLGGIRTGLDEHSWVARLKYDKPRGSGFYCGGVLISSRYVLTAAHCVKGADLPTNWTVSQMRLGEWNTSSDFDCDLVECAPPVIDVDVEEIIAHSEYKPEDGHQQNDIALLRLARDVPFNDFVKPICLPNIVEMRGNSYLGLQIAGWGLTAIRSSSTIKLIGRLPEVEQNTCRDLYRRFGRNITGSQLCAGGNGGKDACRGESGGPLMVQTPPLFNWMVIGIESYGASPCGIRGWPRVYTRVSAYMDWIITNLRP